MNLGQLSNPVIALITPRPAVDMDAVSNLGPEIARHLNALCNLCDNIPNSENLKDKIEDLKSLFGTYLPMQDNMLEKDAMAEGVVHRIDDEDPMNKSEIKILGGAGRYSMAGLRNKAAREAAQLADDLSGKYVDYRGAAHAVKQVANTINTMVAALDELGIDESTGHLSEQMVKHEALKAVGMLRNELVKYGRTGKPLTDQAVNKIMQNVLDKTEHTDQNSLLQSWKSSKAGLTPLQWARQSPDIHDKNIHNTDINAPIDESMRDLCVIEMYETMKVGLGDRAWVAISKRLKAEGHDPALIEAVINRAIVISTDQ